MTLIALALTHFHYDGLGRFVAGLGVGFLLGGLAWAREVDK